MPNRRTVLRDSILAIGLDHPAASQPAFLLKLVKDRTLPPDTRMAIGPKCFPPKRRRGAPTASQTPAVIPAGPDFTPQALEAFFGVVQEAIADPKARRKAAQKIAEFLLPKTAKKPKVTPDEYDFLISAKLAGAYRDIELEVRALVNDPTHKIPDIAQKIKKLQARSAAIRRRLDLPCPSKYGNKEAGNDYLKLLQFTGLRDSATALTEAQNAEEAHVKARFDMFNAGPEAIARRRRAALERAEGRFKAGNGPPLSHKEREDLKFLRWLYPKPHRAVPELEGEGFDLYRDHPFADALRAANGNFYPRRSKLRWLDQLETIEWKKLSPKEDPEDQQKPELLSKSRMHELEVRRAVGFELTASEEQESRDLRQRYPEFAAVVDLIDLSFLYHWRREVEIARKAGLNTVAMFEQADLMCLRWRDPTKFTTVSDAEAHRGVRRGNATEAAALEP